MSTRDSSSSRPQRLGSPPSSRNLSGSPGGASPRSCAVATWVLPTSRGGYWNPSHASAGPSAQLPAAQRLDGQLVRGEVQAVEDVGVLQAFGLGVEIDPELARRLRGRSDQDDLGPLVVEEGRRVQRRE